MRRSKKIKLAALGGLLAVAAAIAIILLTRRSARAPAMDTTPPQKPVAAPIEFTDAGAAARIIKQLEFVERKGRVRAAVSPGKAPRWFCVLVDGEQRYYELDRGAKAEEFAGLAEGGFQPLPAPMARTTSIYRAVARRAVPDFNEDRGDRILVLLCPQQDWPKLALRWPPAPSPAK
ncbi:MAG: hypothetical protein FJ291_24985 [Planctomycetes bacterium]|nr:hypothetical protein [Planctomycetota bacterium]